MIRRGKASGWLTLPTEAFRPWALMNGVGFHEVKQGAIPGRGSALLASKPVTNTTEGAECLLTVPKDLVLGYERVLEHAKVDKDFKAVLESLGDFGRSNLMGHQTPRGAILAFLLVQASTVNPELTERVGVHGSFTDYVKSLPMETLPTFWNMDELKLLAGTTLAPATMSKLKSLRREYDLLCSSAANTRWYSLVQDHLNFNDWLQVDAMYRSRALEYPGIGHCMVPCIDLANHCSHEGTVAIYEQDSEGNAVLVLRDGKSLQENDEVTISYGDEKGACEMLFSYGFLEDTMTSAETLFLSLSIASEDRQQAGKLSIADCAPGFKLIDAGDEEIDWTGDYIWLLCVNEDDKLHFDVARTVDGDEEIHAFFGDHRLTDGAAELRRLLAQSELWDVYRLRAVSLLQQRVFEQLQVLVGTQESVEDVEVPDGGEMEGMGVRKEVLDKVMRLRRLEGELLERAYGDFETQKLELAESEVVQRYLAAMNSTEDGEDFS